MILRSSAASLVAALALCAMTAAMAQDATGGAPAGQGVPADLMPRYLLQDTQGRAVTHEDFRGRFQLITFGFVSCPDVCPTTLMEFKQVLGLLGDKAGRLQTIFVTVDPERDTRDVLRAYINAFDPRILGLTGSPELVRRATETFHVHYEKVREPGAKPGDYTMNHTAGMFLLAPDGRFLAKFPYEMTAREIADKIRQVMTPGGN